jgi:hypothetical protein
VAPASSVDHRLREREQRLARAVHRQHLRGGISVTP